MTPEAYVIKYLEDSMTGVRVFGDVPEENDNSFLTVELTGADMSNQVSGATLAIDAWASTRAEAMQLSTDVKSAMFNMLEQPEISAVELLTEYNNPRISTKHPRYRTMWRIVYVLID